MMTTLRTEITPETLLCRVIATVAAMLIVALYIGTATANSLIRELPDKGGVTISGMVTDIKDKNNFTLTDQEGATITVESKGGATLAKGETVTVEGEVQKSANGKKIAASAVSAASAGKASGSKSGSGKTEGSDAEEGQGAPSEGTY